MKNFLLAAVLFLTASSCFAIDDYYKGKDIFPNKLETCSNYKMACTTVYGFKQKGNKYITNKEFTKYIIKGKEEDKCRLEEIIFDKNANKYNFRVCRIPLEYLKDLSEFFRENEIYQNTDFLDGMYCEKVNSL